MKKQEFAALPDSLEAELDPPGALETITFREILHGASNPQRFGCIETETSRSDTEDFLRREATTILDRVARYQARAQRAYCRAVQEVRALHTNRALRAAKLDRPQTDGVPALAMIREVDQTNPIRRPGEACPDPDLEMSAASPEFLSRQEGECAEIGN